MKILVFGANGPTGQLLTGQALAEGRDPGDLTTIEDPGALEQIRSALARQRE